MEIYNRSKRHDVRNVRGTYNETELDTAALAETIRSTGYEVGEIQKEPYTKKGLFG